MTKATECWRCEFLKVSPKNHAHYSYPLLFKLSSLLQYCGHEKCPKLSIFISKGLTWTIQLQGNFHNLSPKHDVLDGWVRVLRPFNSISVISRRWKGEYEKLCAMKRRLDSGRISPPAGFEPATPWSEVGSANRSATRTLLTWCFIVAINQQFNNETLAPFLWNNSYEGQMDEWMGCFQQYFSHIRTMEGWSWSALCNEAPFRFWKNLASSEFEADLKTPWFKDGRTRS